MEVILLERVAKLGQMGEIVRVKDGYARNFLLPLGKALRANEGNKKRFEAQRAQLEARNLELKTEAQTVAEKLDGQSFIIIRQAGETGQLYGSVSTRDIAEAITAGGVSVQRTQVIVLHPIKMLGLHPVPVRLHSACLTGDLFGSLKCDCGDQLRHTAKFMAENGGGVLLYLDQEGRANGLSNKIRAYALQAKGYDTYDADEVLGFDHDQRGFDFAAEMLRQLGVTRVQVMTNNPAKLAALEAAGLDVVSDRRILGRKTDQNVRYLASKRDRAGHFIDVDDLPVQNGVKE